MSTTPGEVGMPPPASPTPTSPTPRSTISWRIVRSLWLVFPVVGFGFLGGVALVYLGLRVRRPTWWIPGIAYLAFGAAGFFLLDEPQHTTTLGNWAASVLVVAWAASILHACLSNPAWLRWQATRALARAQPMPAAAPEVDPLSWTRPVIPASPPMASQEQIPASGDRAYMKPAPETAATGLPVADVYPSPPAVMPQQIPVRLRQPPKVRLRPTPRVRLRRTPRIAWSNREPDVADWALTPVAGLVIGTLTTGCLFYCVGGAVALCSDNLSATCPSGSSLFPWFRDTVLLFVLGLVALWSIPWWRGLRRLRHFLAGTLIVLAGISPLVLGISYLN